MELKEKEEENKILHEIYMQRKKYVIDLGSIEVHESNTLIEIQEYIYQLIVIQKDMIQSQLQQGKLLLRFSQTNE